ncbi:hypothetical protein O6H91_05G060500 [Diphasiastrum complanatum]|uniref:Uncharacterized protein n=1 Tax=Diphasiastrum complanatum TaxID=34168 RepID=A0ACC2DNM6_DIPCM|nr:hypothetical protein O6H91_05G060500 [Diphasiastrum complanatum]
MATDAIDLLPSHDNVLYCDDAVNPDLPTEAMYSQIRKLSRYFVKSWSHFDDNDLGVAPISGGITNLILKVFVKGSNEEEQPITIRIFGPYTDEVIDRKRELQAILSLSAEGFGPKLIGLFANGMVQSYINARTLEPVDMSRPEIAALIAKEVRRLHETEIPGSREPQLWRDIQKFFDKASVISFEDSIKQKKYEAISFDEINKEIKKLQEVSDALNAPVVYCHNDLLSGNLMVSEKSNKLHLIDFEYGSYNYRGFDIGNHFNEYAGFECDYSLYPDKKAQFHFFRHYLHCKGSQEVSKIELEALYIETNFYALVSHLFWAIWGIVQRSSSASSMRTCCEQKGIAKKTMEEENL